MAEKAEAESDQQVSPTSFQMAAAAPEGEQLLSPGSPKVPAEAVKGRFTLPLILSAVAACGSSFTFGYNLGVVNAPESIVQSWIANISYPALHNSTLDQEGTEMIWSVTVSAFAFAGIFGGLLCGFMAEKFGRKGAMLMNTVLCFAGGLIMSLSKSAGAYPMLIVGRLVIGFNCGLNSGLAPMYLTEIAPVNLRGILGSLNQFTVVMAIWTSNLLGFDFLLGTAKLWPLMFGFTIIPAILQVIALPMCPESPKYLLIGKNLPEEAEKVLKRLRQEQNVSVELAAIQQEADEIASVPKVKFVDMFKNSVLRWALIISIVMMLSQQLSGINAAMFFSGNIFKNYAGLSEHNHIVGATLGMNSVMLVMTFIATVVIDLLGRRLLMLSGMAGMFVSSLMVVIFLVLAKSGHGFAVYLAIVSVCLFVAFFAIGPGPIPWFFVSELFDQGARSNANAVAVMLNWVASFLVGQLFLPWQRAVEAYAFLLFTGCLIVLGIFVFLYAPETKGRRLEEVKEELRKKAPGGRRG